MSIRSAVQIAAVTIAAVSAAHVHAGLEQDHCGPQINLEVSAAPVIRTTTSSSAAGSSFQLTGTSIITPSSPTVFDRTTPTPSMQFLPSLNLTNPSAGSRDEFHREWMKTPQPIQHLDLGRVYQAVPTTVPLANPVGTLGARD